MPTFQRYLPYLFLTAAVFAVYANVFDNVFLFDDDLLIVLNTYLRGWDTFPKLFAASTTEGAHIAGGFYRPVQNFLYFFIFQLGGANPLGFHVLNVGLHAANACFGYRLALKLGIDPAAALFAMLIWALHPLHTEAVTYMSGTADPLFVMFCLVGVNVLFNPTPTTQRIWLSLPFFILALLSKETAVVFPALVCVCLYFTSDDRLKLKTYLPTWPLWLIAFAFLAWRVNAVGFDGPARYAMLYHLPEYARLKMYAEDPFMRVMTFMATLPAYAALLLWPAGLHMERTFSLYDDPTALPVLIGFVMLAAALAQIVMQRGKKSLPLSWGLLWFGAAHVPNAGILFPMNSLFLEHWMYLPSMGLFLGIAQTLLPHVGRNEASRIAASCFAMIAIVGLSAATYRQNEIWREPVAFYNNIFSYGVTSARAHNNLAIAYQNHNNLPQAIEQYHEAIKEGDTYAETHYNLALAILSQPDPRAHFSEAITELERSLQLEPRFYRSYMTLSQIYREKGDITSADVYAHKASEILGKQ